MPNSAPTFHSPPVDVPKLITDTQTVLEMRTIAIATKAAHWASSVKAVIYF
jgi:hypothetical protein